MSIILGAMTGWRVYLVLLAMILLMAIMFAAAIRVVDVTVTSPSGQETHGSFRIWPWNSVKACINKFATQVSPASTGRMEVYEVRAFFGLVVVDQCIQKTIAFPAVDDGGEK